MQSVNQGVALGSMPGTHVAAKSCGPGRVVRRGGGDAKSTDLEGPDLLRGGCGGGAGSGLVAILGSGDGEEPGTGRDDLPRRDVYDPSRPRGRGHGRPPETGRRDPERAGECLIPDPPLGGGSAQIPDLRAVP